MASRKDFVKTAVILAAVRNDAERAFLIQEFIGVYGEQNPRFNAKKFTDYIAKLRSELIGAFR